MIAKVAIENRILAVTSYAGAMPLPEIISKAATRAKLPRPDWWCACACMTPAEYAKHGKGGAPWKHLEHRPDMAERARDVARAYVEDLCSRMNLNCDWTQIHARVRRAA